MQFNVLRGFLVEEHATRARKILLSLFRGTLMIKENVTLSSTKEGKIQKTKQNLRDWSKSMGGGGPGAFGNVVDKKQMTHPLPSAQK